MTPPRASLRERLLAAADRAMPVSVSRLRESCEENLRLRELLREAADALTEWPCRYFCDGPQGSFWSDDIDEARRLLNAGGAAFEDWTITDMEKIEFGKVRASAPTPGDER